MSGHSCTRSLRVFPRSELRFLLPIFAVYLSLQLTTTLFLLRAIVLVWLKFRCIVACVFLEISCRIFTENLSTIVLSTPQFGFSFIFKFLPTIKCRTQVFEGARSLVCRLRRSRLVSAANSALDFSAGTHSSWP